MKLEHYELETGEQLSTYEFWSEGLKGKILKIIIFTEIYPDYFNLAFGDFQNGSGEIDDLIISNNGDSNKIFATIIHAIYDFTDKNPFAWIYVTGSTKSRTRIYRMGISKHIEEAIVNFFIFGQIANNWVPYGLNQKFNAFLVRRK